ncbi:hypothetical protein AGLY_006742 [Aphis glycines]|uniref:Uncharacterized protein n=1 Tax=Aphis glycines TaxID=307491 RepID=A0A6G0TR12_APHGL|nr:hypothetical protein AGLY_006742 [Aphis glycines]
MDLLYFNKKTIISSHIAGHLFTIPTFKFMQLSSLENIYSLPQFILKVITYGTTNLFLFTPELWKISEYVSLLHLQTSMFHPNNLKNRALVFVKFLVESLSLYTFYIHYRFVLSVVNINYVLTIILEFYRVVENKYLPKQIELCIYIMTWFGKPTFGFIIHKIMLKFVLLVVTIYKAFSIKTLFGLPITYLKFLLYLSNACKYLYIHYYCHFVSVLVALSNCVMKSEIISDSSFDDNGLNTNMSPSKKKSKLKSFKNSVEELLSYSYQKTIHVSDLHVINYRALQQLAYTFFYVGS